MKRRDFDRACKLAKSNFYKEQLSNCQKDQKKFWNLVSDFFGSKTDAINDKVYEYGTENLLGESDSIEEINHFFAAIGERVTKEFRFLKYSKDTLPSSVDILCDFRTMSTGEFLGIVAELKCSKSSGIDDLNSRLMITAMIA